jgi:hypothetical protein
MSYGSIRHLLCARIPEQMIVRKIYGTIKEEECWRIRTNKEIKHILQWIDIVKFINSL